VAAVTNFITVFILYGKLLLLLLQVLSWRWLAEWTASLRVLASHKT
jgi:hypothetical protein